MVVIFFINKIVINQVISYWPSYRSSASCIGPADLGPVTGPIRNYLINNIILFGLHEKNRLVFYVMKQQN